MTALRGIAAAALCWAAWWGSALACSNLAAEMREEGLFSEAEIAREVQKCEEERDACVASLVEEDGKWFRVSERRVRGRPVGTRDEIRGVATRGAAESRCGTCAGLVGIGNRGSMPECLENAESSWVVGWLGRRVASIGRAVWEQLSDPEGCFSCVVLLFVIGSLHAVGEAGFGALSDVAIVVGPVIFLLWLAVKLGRHLTGVTPDRGFSAWQEIGPGAARFAVAAVLLMMASEGGSGVYSWMVENVVGPGLVSGMEIGAGVSRGVLAGSGGVGEIDAYVEERWEAMRDSSLRRLPASVAAAVGPGGVAEGMADGAMRLVSALHLVGSMGLSRAVGYLADAGQASNKIGGMVALLVGGLLMMLFGVFLVMLGVQLVDPFLRVAVALAASPLLVVAWVFPASQAAAWVGLRTLLYAIAFFVVAGIVYGMAMQIVLLSIVGAGDFSEGIEAFLRNLNMGLDAIEQQSAGGDLDVVKPVVTALMTMVAMGLARQAGQIAGMFASFGAQGGVAEAVEQRTMGFGGQAMAFGWQGAMLAMGGGFRAGRGLFAGRSGGAAGASMMR